jgi:hypothetical protein
MPGCAPQTRLLQDTSDTHHEPQHRCTGCCCCCRTCCCYCCCRLEYKAADSRAGGASLAGASVLCADRSDLAEAAGWMHPASEWIACTTSCPRTGQKRLGCSSCGCVAAADWGTEAAATTSLRAAQYSESRTILSNELCCFVHDSPDVRGRQDHADGLGLESENQTQHTCTRTIIVICKYDTVRWQHYYQSMQRPTPRLSCCCCRL